MELQYDQKIPAPQNLKVTPFSSSYQLKSLAVKKLPSEGLSIKYSPDDQYIAIGCRNGSRLLYSTQEHKIIERYECINENSVTCLKWRPNSQGRYNVLATSDADGNLNFWHIPSMKRIFNLSEDNNSILCLDFNSTGDQFATAGKDCNIRIYDEQTKSLAVTCKSAQWNSLGHDNRVFCIKYIDNNTIMSGGWDSVVHFWDVREGKSIKHFLGPHISGESLDYQNGKILAGCYSASKQIQIWDYGSCNKIQQIDWSQNIDDAQYIYTALYSSYDMGLWGAGSTGKNSQVRLYSNNNKMGMDGRYKRVGSIGGLSQGCFSMDFGHRCGQVAFTTAHHGLYVYDCGRK